MVLNTERLVALMLGTNLDDTQTDTVAGTDTAAAA
jgi:hypothetical protein